MSVREAFSGSALASERQTRAAFDGLSRGLRRATEEDIEINAVRRLYIVAPNGLLYLVQITNAPAITVTAPNGTVTTIGPGVVGSGYSVVTKIAGYTETATSGELVIKADLAAGFTIVLPTAVGNTAKIHVKKMQAAGSIVLDGAGTETIDGGLTATLTSQYETLTLVSDNVNWLII